MGKLQLDIKWKNAKIHILCWILFIVYEGVIYTISLNRVFPIDKYTFFYYILNISIFYFHTYFFQKALYYHLFPKTLRIVVLILGEITLYIMLSYIFEEIFRPNTFQSNSIIVIPFISKILWRCLYFITFSTAYSFIQKFIKESKRSSLFEKQALTTRLEKHQLETELAQSQNAFLRSQINPHFLFNTLNYIYRTTRKAAPDGAQAILNLSAIMRYALENEDTGDTALLTEEVEQVKLLIDLYRLRDPEECHVALHVSPNIQGIRIPALILITLAENMFKHGRLEKDSPAEISIMREGSILKVSSRNAIGDVNQNNNTGKGLDNIHQRLKAYFKEKALFHFHQDDSGIFHTEIKIREIEQSNNIAITSTPPDIP